METVEYDAVVVGAGPGGYPCAIRLGQLGKKTLCIEKENWGGVCLNVGCIPSKALISAAKRYQELKSSAALGINVSGDISIDMAQTQEWKQGIVKRLTGGVDFLLKSNGVDRMIGTAEFPAGKSVVVTKADGSQIKVKSDNVILAVGSRPIEIPGFSYSEDRIWDSTKALAQTTIPDRLAVIGGGYIGLEMGMMFAKLGTEVTVVEMGASVLGLFDKDVVKVITKKMKKLGIKTLTKVRAEGWEEGDNGAVLKVRKEDNSIQEVECDNILVTVGRRPNSEQLSAMGIELNDRGYVVTDDQQRTNVDGVYAIGDITGRTMLAHGASYEGELAAEVIAGHNRHYQALTVPAVVFTDPEIGVAGLQEHEAIEKGHTVKIGQMPFAALGRAMTTGGSTDGFFKVILDDADNRVLGVTIVGPNASDLISEAALAVELWAEGLDLGLTIHPHPTLGEGMMEAAKHALGEAIHIANKK